ADRLGGAAAARLALIRWRRGMIGPARHVPFRPLGWSQTEAAAPLDDIVAGALDPLRPEPVSPAPPPDRRISGGRTRVHGRAAGVIWAIDRLGRAGACRRRFDFRPVLPRLMEATQAELPDYGEYAAHGSLLFGDLCTALLVMRLDPTTAIADLIHRRADANTA